MAKAFGKLGADLRRLGANVERNAPKLLRATALAIDSAVVTATPVDTGRARSNWQVSIGSPILSVRESYSQGAAAGQFAMAQARAVIEGYKSGQTIFINNNLPYIGRLNDGWSAQAPAGFIRFAVLVGVNAGRQFGSLLEKRG